MLSSTRTIEKAIWDMRHDFFEDGVEDSIRYSYTSSLLFLVSDGIKEKVDAIDSIIHSNTNKHNIMNVSKFN